MREKTVAERLRGITEGNVYCRTDPLSIAANGISMKEKASEGFCIGVSCFECMATMAHELADAIEAEQAELRDLLDFQRDTFTRERDCLCKDIEELKRKTSEYKRMLDFRKELADENGVVLKGLRDLANTSKYHTNTEWKRIVMRLTENAEDYANRVIAEAMAQAKEKQNGVDVDALLKVAKSLERFTGIPSYSAPYITPADCSRWARTIRDAVKGANASNSMPLPEGVIWPTYEDGELVKIGSEISIEGVAESVTSVGFYETHVCITTDTGSYEGHYKFKYGEPLKRPESDTAESILSEMVSAIECEDCVDLDPYIKRYRKLKGGESHE